MYKFKPISERMQLMHQLIRDRVIQSDSETAMITTRCFQENENLIPCLRRPIVLKAICEQMTVRVEDFEMIVGNSSKKFCGTGYAPDWGGTGMIPFMIEKGIWTRRDDGLYHNPDEEELRMSIAPEDYENLVSISDYWKGRTYNDIAAAWQPKGYEELCRMQVSATVKGTPLLMMPSGHLTPGFKKIINMGYGAIRKQAQDWLDSHVNNLMGEDANRNLFYTAVVISCDAASSLLKRYGTKCLEKAASCTDEKRKTELESMADSLIWISENPCRTFREACQAAIMYQYILRLSFIGDIGSFGRFDQYTWPYLKKDLEAGRLSPEEAQEIVDCFFMKINSMYGGGFGELIKIIGIGNTYLHTTIGGVDPKTGEDSSNPVTYMVLESLSRLSLHDPTISLRVNKNTPNELWALALETSTKVGGLPLFQNDDIIIPGIIKELGFTLEDARDYAIIGCQEITGSGNDYSAANGVAPPHASIHYSKLLDMAINDGKNPFNGEQCSIHTGHLYDMKSFDEVKEAWRKLAGYFLKAQVSLNNYLEYLVQYHTPHPLLSISLDGCMESGKDCTSGGAKYNSYGGTATGLATVADSLTAIKYMVFDKKLCTARELYDAVMANWEGYESLRQQIINEAPHFGNADPYADEQMTWVINTYYDTCKECCSIRTKIFKAGLYGAADHVGQGYTTWATPDGRKAGTPIADAASPVQSRDTNGPTAVFLSSLCYDHSRFMDGVCLNIRLHPTTLRRDDGIAKLRDMVKTYMNKGGAEAQFNVVSTEVLHKAQKNPDEYRNLVVRIAGYSAYFVELTRDCQNDLISRHENMI
jgi:pyruvate formate-lyase/glycerol dehydratase family glycyl radical enzyme